MTRLQRKSGVTLLEVNLAMGVLLFGVVSVSSLFPTGLKLAEQGYRASDCAFIASLARNQLDLLASNSSFTFPGQNDKSGDVEGRLNETVPGSGAPAFKTISCARLKEDNSKLGWTSNCWKDSYMLMTSGGEAGKIFLISGNTTTSITLSVDVAGLKLRKFDSFRVIYKHPTKPGTTCVPANFLSASSETIPTINGLVIDALEQADRSGSLQDIRASNATALKTYLNNYTNNYTGISTYSYAMVLDAPTPASPGLYRAYILIYKGYSDSAAPWNNTSPIAYYVCFYRKPSLLK